MNPFKEKLTYVLTAVMTYYVLIFQGVWFTVPTLHDFRYRTTLGDKFLAYGTTTVATVLLVFPLAVGIVYAIKLGVNNNKKGE